MPTTRRSFLTRSATLAALAPVADLARAADAPAGAPDLVLETSEKEMVFDGTVCRVRTYNGTLPGPVIKARPGDRKVIRLKNSLPLSSSKGWDGNHNVPHGFGGTNLHFHGLDVQPHLFKPLGTLDPLAPMIIIEPGQALDYPLDIPLDHPPGLYWYHPHKHGSTAVQAVSGMAGPIVIMGEIDEVPEIKAASDIALVVQDLGMFPDHHSQAAAVAAGKQAQTYSYQPQQNAIWQTFQQDQVTVYDPATGQNVPQPAGTQGFTTGDYPRRFFLLNGKPFFVENHDPKNSVCPAGATGKAPAQCPIAKQLPVQRIELAPGQVVRFRMLNGCSDNMMPLVVEGHDVHLLAMDGRNFPAVRKVAAGTVPQMQLAPANRVEFMIRAGQPGTYKIKQLAQNEQFLYSAEKVIAEIVVTKTKPMTMALPTKLPVIKRYYPLIKPEQVTRRRRFVFSGSFPGYLNPVVGLDFMINNAQYNELEVPTTVRVGQVEEWILSVPDAANGGTEGHPFHIHVNGFEVVAINGKPIPPDQVQILDTVWVPVNTQITVRTAFKQFAGKAVYHCHILPHEDTGMMQNILILPAARASSGNHDH